MREQTKQIRQRCYLRRPNPDHHVAGLYDQDRPTAILIGHTGTYLYNVPTKSWAFVDSRPTNDYSLNRQATTMEPVSTESWTQQAKPWSTTALWLDRLRLKRVASWLFNGKLQRQLNLEPPRIEQGDPHA